MAERVLCQFEDELLAWLDAEALRRDRSRAWMVNHVCKLYAGNLQRARNRRAAALGSLKAAAASPKKRRRRSRSAE